jgi:electron-transferring-flavoprotein dehydrogenase
MTETIHRETMNYDVVIVGGGVAGLSAAIKIKQLNADVSVVVLEKGANIGSHIVSGAVMDISAITELFPNKPLSEFPFQSAVTNDAFYYLTKDKHFKIPAWLMPPFMHNKGNYILSLGNVCEWLAIQAEALGVEIYAGMAVSEIVYNDTHDTVIGVVAGVFGIATDGTYKSDYQAGMMLCGQYTLFAEGARGSLTKQLIAKFNLDKDSEPQKYGIGFKEIWEVKPENFNSGTVIHTVGSPLDTKAGGGGFLYMSKDNCVAVGMVIHLNYENPTLSPYDEFQQMKHHPLYAKILSGGRRISYGARVINEGGLQSIPKVIFQGGALIGCSAGFVNVPRIKGSHNAIQSGMLAGVTVVNAIRAGGKQSDLTEYETLLKQSSIYQELKIVRNVKPLWSKFGLLGGVVLGGLDMWFNHLFGVSIFGTLKHGKADNETLKPLKDVESIKYPKPDGILSFDKLTNVSFTATYHAENQRCHLQLKDIKIPIEKNLPLYGEPARLYCPAGVYEVVYDNDGKNPKFQINSQNCIHCKTCDIKDPSNNITWTVPEGSGGPHYSGM